MLCSASSARASAGDPQRARCATASAAACSCQRQPASGQVTRGRCSVRPSGAAGSPAALSLVAARPNSAPATSPCKAPAAR
ncbi:hypothetical protein HPP92_009627 [Vanilla planifolia]|uniref:Uncharacterized protein n=1 Tax=Vanilla planifolia TaxID=51239 RepID=A0A835RG61_VANPL|nr:hypothetical protein HPP92_009857 [Vanilla planifolia]KAG0487532.1 hypothetical protein HPP92_009627 [Vanilla planifolia]